MIIFVLINQFIKMRLFPLLLLFPTVVFANIDRGETLSSDSYEASDLGACTECHRQVYPIKSLDKYKKEYIDVFHGKDENTCIYYNKNRPVLYRWEKDNEIIYLLPSKVTDNPHIIK